MSVPLSKIWTESVIIDVKQVFIALRMKNSVDYQKFKNNQTIQLAKKTPMSQYEIIKKINIFK